MAVIPKSLIKAAQRQPMPVARGQRASGEVLRPGSAVYEGTSTPGAQASDKPMDVSATSEPPKRPVAPGLPPIAPRPEPAKRTHVPTGENLPVNSPPAGQNDYNT